jgi:hypothetical protein
MGGTNTSLSGGLSSLSGGGFNIGQQQQVGTGSPTFKAPQVNDLFYIF